MQSNPRKKYQDVIRLFSGKETSGGDEGVPGFKIAEQEKLLPRYSQKVKGQRNVVPPPPEEQPVSARRLVALGVADKIM